MSKQYDLQPTVDPTPWDQVGPLQLLQLVSTQLPVANIGGIVVQNTPPDVANNPRFTRYVWLDSSTSPASIKLYDGAAWGAAGVAVNSITNKMLQDRQVGLRKLTYRTLEDGGQDISKSHFIVRLDVNGEHMEIVPLSQAIEELDLGVGLSTLEGGTAGYIIMADANGDAVWSQLNLSNDLAEQYKLKITNIKVGGNEGQVPTIVGGAMVWKTPNDATASGSLTLDKFGGNNAAGGAPQDLQVPQYTAGVGKATWITPLISKEFVHTSAALAASGADYQRFSIAHGMANIRNISARLVCLVNDDNWLAGDEITLDSVESNDAGNTHRPIAVMVRGANVYGFVSHNASDFQAIDPSTFDKQTLTKTRWGIKVVLTGN